MLIKDLLDLKILIPGDQLHWYRKIINKVHEARVLPDGRIQTSDGAIFNSPSGAAKHFSNGVAVDGWRVWEVTRLTKKLEQIRIKQ